MSGSALIDRGRELRVLEDALATATAGEPQVVLVEGEAGVGKSSLLRAFRDGHAEVRTLAWAGDDAESRLSFAMVDQLVESAMPWPDPFTAGAALLTRLDELVAEGPVMLALDDVHLADRASLVAVNFAIRRLRQSQVLAVLCARDHRVAELPASILRIASDSDRRLVLGSLTTSGVQQLAGELGVRAISHAAAERLRCVARGNPLHLTALLTEVPVEELERLDRPLPAPESFGQLVLARLASTSPEARTVARAAAVLGDRCELTDLTSVAGLEQEVALGGLEELARLRVLRVPPGATTAVFDDPLVRAAVYGDLGPATRTDLHRTAAGVLDGWAGLRHRTAATHGPDPGLAADLESWAEYERDAGGVPEAAEAMLAAHRASPPGAEADRRLLAAVALFVYAGHARAAQCHAAAFASLPLTGPRLAVEARLAWLTGRLDDAVEIGRLAWARSDLDPSERDLLAAMLAQIEILRDNAEDAVAWAQRALEEGRLAQDAASHTRATLALGLAVAGGFSEALTTLANLSAGRDCDVRRHPELATRARLTSWESPPSAVQDDFVVASALADGDMQPFRLAAAAHLGESFFRSGHWGRSRATLLQTLALAEDTNQSWMLGFLHSSCAAVPAAQGDWTTAAKHVAIALDRGRVAGEVATAAYADEAAVLLATAQGDPDGVVRAAERIRAAAGNSLQRNFGLFWWPAHLISALVELGRLDEAEDELELLVRSARPGGQRTKAARMRLAGQLAAARRDVGRARSCFVAALAVDEDQVDVLERALVHGAYGRFLRRRGERRSAIEQLQAASVRFTALGAAPFAERCDRELAACGAHTSEAVPIDDLTPQERTVATLVCAGKTNREAAQELVLSVKTVGYHLRNVYSKLGVHSRAQLVVTMRDRGRGPGTPAPTP